MSVWAQNAVPCCPRTAEKRVYAMNGGNTHAEKAAVYYRKWADARPAGKAGALYNKSSTNGIIELKRKCI